MQRRVVVASIGDETPAVAEARRLRDEGLEVVYVGGDGSPESIAHIAIAEDVTRVVLAGEATSLERVREHLRGLGADDVEVVEPGD